MNKPLAANRNVLEAASFAARAHAKQLRKDGRTPYAAHPFRVCLIVRQIFGIDDPEVLTAALLHDTIEDTTTDFDEPEEKFGARVAALSKDMRLPEGAQKTADIQTRTGAESAAKIAKLADIFDNLTDSRHLSVAARRRTIERSDRYLTALEVDLPEIARRPLHLVRQPLGELGGAAEPIASYGLIPRQDFSPGFIPPLVQDWSIPG